MPEYTGVEGVKGEPTQTKIVTDGPIHLAYPIPDQDQKYELTAEKYYRQWILVPWVTETRRGFDGGDVSVRIPLRRLYPEPPEDCPMPSDEEYRMGNWHFRGGVRTIPFVIRTYSDGHGAEVEVLVPFHWVNENPS